MFKSATAAQAYGMRRGELLGLMWNAVDLDDREIAGHSDIKVTMTVYAHGRLDEKAAALARLGAAVAGALPSPVAVKATETDRQRP